MAEYRAEYSVFVNTSWIWLSPPTRLPRPTSRHDASPAHLKEKAQHAGYKAPVEKWDTDSDSSDGSGDELDLAV